MKSVLDCLKKREAPPTRFERFKTWMKSAMNSVLEYFESRDAREARLEKERLLSSQSSIDDSDFEDWYGVDPVNRILLGDGGALNAVAPAVDPRVGDRSSAAQFRENVTESLVSQSILDAASAASVRQLPLSYADNPHGLMVARRSSSGEAKADVAPHAEYGMYK